MRDHGVNYPAPSQDPLDGGALANSNWRQLELIFRVLSECFVELDPRNG